MMTAKILLTLVVTLLGLATLIQGELVSDKDLNRDLDGLITLTNKLGNVVAKKGKEVVKHTRISPTETIFHITRGDGEIEMMSTNESIFETNSSVSVQSTQTALAIQLENQKEMNKKLDMLVQFETEKHRTAELKLSLMKSEQKAREAKVKLITQIQNKKNLSALGLTDHDLIAITSLTTTLQQKNRELKIDTSSSSTIKTVNRYTCMIYSTMEVLQSKEVSVRELLTKNENLEGIKQLDLIMEDATKQLDGVGKVGVRSSVIVPETVLMEQFKEIENETINKMEELIKAQH